MQGLKSAAAQALSDSNHRLRRLLAVLAPEEGIGTTITHEHLTLVLAELLRAGEWLQNRHNAGSDPALDMELAAYRKNVERLREVLPTIQAHLLTERARLEEQRAQLEAAAAWARASHKTF